MQAVSQTTRQSNQQAIQRIYEARSRLQSYGVTVAALWTVANDDMTMARKELQQLIRKEVPVDKTRGQDSVMKSVVAAATKARIAAATPVSSTVERAVKAIDTAFPGKHTKTLYRSRSGEEAGVLAQLRTGARKLNGYLFKIGAVEFTLCACNASIETVRHFLSHV